MHLVGCGVDFGEMRGGCRGVIACAMGRRNELHPEMVGHGVDFGEMRRGCRGVINHTLRGLQCALVEVRLISLLSKITGRFSSGHCIGYERWACYQK